MIKVQRMFWAAVDATHDRRFVAKSANKKLKGIDVNLYKAITKTQDNQLIVLFKNVKIGKELIIQIF